mmetsp:Transcript_29493/g.78002  ORF Transcript_29493/g.78002 Transcript_29493/m.78002 type:complete len:91 (-) Transcript_29493:465-737(-)
MCRGQTAVAQTKRWSGTWQGDRASSGVAAGEGPQVPCDFSQDFPVCARVSSVGTSWETQQAGRGVVHGLQDHFSWSARSLASEVLSRREN